MTAFDDLHLKSPLILAILFCLSSANFMLNSVEHEIDFITSGPEMDKHTSKPHFEKILK